MVALIKDCHTITQCHDVYALLIEQGFLSDPFFGSTLIDKYAKFGSIDYACMVFLRLPQQDVVTWTALILGYALHGFCEEAFQLFNIMQQGGMEPNEVTCFCLIKACSTSGALALGKSIHVYLASRGFDSSCLITHSLSDMYMKCGSSEDAVLIFRKQPSQDVVAWNIIIAGHSQSGGGKEALQLFQQMQQSDVVPNETTFVSVLQACANIGGLGYGEHIHKMVLKNGYTSNIYVGNSLVHMYVNCGELDKASAFFCSLPNQDAITWNILISGFSQQGYTKKVFELYTKMMESELSPNNLTFVSVLDVCSGKECLGAGLQIHNVILKLGLESCLKVNKAIVLMYARCGSSEEFKEYIHTLPSTSGISWNAVIIGLMQHENTVACIPFLHQMCEMGSETLEATCVFLLRSCSSNDNLWLLHAFIVDCGLETDLSLANTLIEVYTGLSGLNDVCLLFNRLPQRDLLLRSKLIEAYVQYGYTAEAVCLLDSLVHELGAANQNTFANVLEVCSSINSLIHGKQAHAWIVKLGFDAYTLVTNALITMYAKCGSLDDSFVIFDVFPSRDVVTWNAILSGLVGCSLFEEALEIFEWMQDDGVEYNQVTFICVLQACADLADLQFGQGVHTLIVKLGIHLDLQARNTLIDMYGKCSRPMDAALVFSELSECDVASWNILIGAAAKNGSFQGVLSLFDQMQRENFEPNEFTYASVLQSSSVVADTDIGMQVHLMVLKKGYDSDTFVSSSLINMYAKSNSLELAHKVFECLPVKNTVVWNSLIAGYVLNGQFREANNLFKVMESQQIAPTRSTLLCMVQVCAGLESWREGTRIHALIIDQGLQDSEASSCLIDMYSRCWFVECASVVFNQSSNQDLFLWHAWVASQLNHGQAKDALHSFKQMQLRCLHPDSLFLILISRVCSSLAAFDQGNEVYSLIVEYGFHLDISVGNALITMYTKCGSLEDANLVFHRLPERNLTTWSVMISGFAEHNHYALAVSFFEQIHEEGLVPDNVAYLSMLSACSNAGLVNEGSAYFKRMRDELGLQHLQQHYYCMVDLLGQNGRIDEAKDLLDTLPHAADRVAWSCLVKSCKAHGNLIIGQQCFDYLQDKDAADYIHMSDLYKEQGLHRDSEKTEFTRKSKMMWKKPGRASIEINKHVHEFIVGDCSHPDSDKIFEKLKSLKLPSQGKQDASCGHCEKLAVAFGLLSLPEGTTIRIAKNLRVCSDCHRDIITISKSTCREIIVADTKYVHHFKDGICSCDDRG